MQERANLQSFEPALTVHKISCTLESALNSDVNSLDKLIDASPLYALKKRCAYLTAFTEYVEAIVKGSTFKKPTLDATYLDYAFKKKLELCSVLMFRGRC